MYTFTLTWSHRAISIHPCIHMYHDVSRYIDTTRYSDTHVSPPLRVYTPLMGPRCDVFKGSTHHGGLGLSLRFSKPRAGYPLRCRMTLPLEENSKYRSVLRSRVGLHTACCTADAVEMVLQQHVRPHMSRVRAPIDTGSSTCTASVRALNCQADGDAVRASARASSVP